MKSLILTVFISLFSFHLEAVDYFPYDPPTNFSLFMRPGAVFHPVTTTDEEAQRYFDQGLTLIYAFNHDAAFWSFKKAAEIDPNLAMAYWGMALALGSNINTEITPERSKVAYELMQKSESLSATASSNEQAYIQALATRYTRYPYADQQQLSKKYNEAMKKVVEKFPDDLDAATLYAESGMDLYPWDLWDNNGNPRKGTMEVLDTLESVLKREPMHLGANHYFIHAIEASKYPERGLTSARRLRKILPNSGHILHMPAHIYILVGDYHKAALCNEKAVEADREYIQKFGTTGMYPLHYMSHNLYFLSRAYSMEGRFKDAKKAGDELYNFYAPHFQMMPELEYYVPTTLFVLLRFHRWQEILEMPAPHPDMQVTTVLWHFARGMAFASLGKLESAQEEQKLFLQGASRIPANAIYGYNEAKPIFAIADAMLKSKIAEMEQDPQAAIRYLQQAVSIQDTLHYNEPPDWFFSVRESLGGLLLRNQKIKEAEKVFRDDLAKHPRNGRSLFGLLMSLQAQSRQTDAAWVQHAFEKAWKYSTEPLTINDL